jgi:AcrR family transcriptional regulator
MVGIVAESGYEAVTAREIARISGVSTRAFYKHFESKEECFLRTHELIVRRVARQIVITQAGERDWRRRLRLAFNAFVRELAREPQAARLALVEAYSAGPAALERIRRSQCTFEAMLVESFGRAPDTIVVPQLVIEGVVAGAERIARARVAAGRERELLALGDDLAEWALCYRSEAAASLVDLDRIPVPGGPPAWLSPAPSSGTEEGGARARSLTNDRALLLFAVAKLAVAEGYGRLTVPRICKAAGVSRRGFGIHFDGVGDCFLAALEERARGAMAHATAARAGAASWPGGVHRAVASLCAQIAADPTLANLCFVEAFAPGGDGMRCRERLMAEIVELLRNAAPAGGRTDDFTAEAAVGAIWGVIHHCVVSGRAHQLPRAGAMLSYLALAPAVGARAAVTAIEDEADEIVRKHRVKKLDRSDGRRNGHRVDEMLVPMR